MAGWGLLPVCMFAAVPATASAEPADSVKTDKVEVAFRSVDERDLMGAVSKVDMFELTGKSYSTYSLDGMNAMVGGYNGQLWNQGEALVLVDGVPRDASNVMPTEIESITFLKGASGVVLYGSRAAKGVVLITTKRGTTDGLQVNVRGNAGLYVPKRYPKYLGSAQYMTLYNEALQNDGLNPVYTEEDIYHYAAGDNPYRYPDVQFFTDEYLKKSCERYDGTAEFSGGGKYAHFYANIGLAHAGDLIKFGEGKKNGSTRLNVRGNIDLRLNDWVTGWVNANATFYDLRGDNSGFWASSSTLRPTSEDPLVPLIPLSYLEENDYPSWTLVDNSSNVIDGKYMLGGTQSQQTNPFAGMYAGGYNKYTSRQMQFDAGICLDLMKVLQGLSFKTHFAVDYATSYTTGIYNDYATYQASWNNYSGKDLITSFNKFGTDKHTGTQTVSNSYDKQTILLSAQFDYDRSFGGHNVAATLLGHGYQQTMTGEYHRTSNVNLGLQLNYNYQHRYYADFSAACSHSAKLAEGHRGAVSPVATLGWRLKGESWLKDARWIDDLKLTASYGVVNQDLDISDYYMYDEVFTATGTWWGWSESANSLQTSDSQRGANKDLTYIKRKEFRAGLNARLLNGLVELDANFFNVNTNGLLTSPSTVMPSYFYTYWPVSSMLPNMNYNNQRRQGIDFTVNLKKKVGGVALALGLSGMYYKSKNTKVNENVEYDWLKTEGCDIESLRGYECLGFFADEQDVASSAKINNNTRPGDLKYKDQNGDGIIDSKDMVVLGKWTSPFVMGINFTAKYKGFTLYACGSGGFGGKGIKNNATEWVYGSGKYSERVLGRWTPETAATADFPRLTTQGGELNFVNSSFWLYDTSAFTIDKVQLTYDFPKSLFGNMLVKGLQVYAAGYSLLTIAKERKYMETSVGASPYCRFYNLGVKIDL